MMKRSLYFLGILGLAAALVLAPLASPPRAAQAQSGASVSISPSAGTILIGDTVTVDVDVANVPGDSGVNAFDVTVGFDPGVLTLSSWSFGGFLDSPQEIVSLETSNSIRVAGAQFDKPEQTGSGTLLRLVFTGSGLGKSTLSLDNADLIRADGSSVGHSNHNASVTVTMPNRAPIALDDYYNALEDVELIISNAGSGVLDNDSDPDGDRLSVVLVSGPAHGSVDLYDNGTFRYSPDKNYNGSDGFTYRAYDGKDYSDKARVSISVDGTNDPPVAQGDSYITFQNTTLDVSAPGLLGNDKDIDGDNLSAKLVTGAKHGKADVNDDGSFSYTPDAGFSGSDSFTYHALDNSSASNAVTVSITVKAVWTPEPKLTNTPRLLVPTWTRTPTRTATPTITYTPLPPTMTPTVHTSTPTAALISMATPAPSDAPLSVVIPISGMQGGGIRLWPPPWWLVCIGAVGLVALTVGIIVLRQRRALRDRLGE